MSTLYLKWLVAPTTLVGITNQIVRESRRSDRFMPQMNAAVITSFGDQPPHYQTVRSLPQNRETRMPTASSRCTGRRPASHGCAPARAAPTTPVPGRLPMIPGVDGVGRRDGRPAGLLRWPTTTCPRHDGPVRGRRSTVAVASSCLTTIDVAAVAATMNPAMSVLGGAASAGSRSNPVRACSCSVPPATPGRWPCGWPGASGPGRIVGAGRDPHSGWPMLTGGRRRRGGAA